MITVLRTPSGIHSDERLQSDERLSLFLTESIVYVQLTLFGIDNG